MEQLDVVEKWGDSVDQAVDLALRDMKLTRDDVDVEVLEEPSRGFLGIVGQKLARVKVTRKGAAEKEEVKEEKSFEPVQKKAPAEIKTEEKEEEPRQERRWKKNTNKKPLSDLIDTEESLTPEATVEDLDFHKHMKELPPCEDHPALTFLKDVVADMGLDLKMDAKADDSNIYIELSGEDCGTIIGRRGQTLDAIQYLTSLVVNKGSNEYIRVKVDTENYRKRRKDTLENLAKNLACKVKRTKRPVTLEPMNPYERRVIHSALQNDKYVSTHSEGEEPFRRVVITLNK